MNLHTAGILGITPTAAIVCNHTTKQKVIFGFNSPSLHFPNLQTAVILGPGEYSSQLRSKLLEIRELVDANMVKYKSSSCPQLKEGQKVLLSNATKGKLDPW